MVHSDAVIKKWYTDVAFYRDFWWDFNGINWGFSGYSLPGIGENCWCLMQKKHHRSIATAQKKNGGKPAPGCEEHRVSAVQFFNFREPGKKKPPFSESTLCCGQWFCFSVDRIIENVHGKLSLFFSQLWVCITLRRWLKDRVLPEKIGISSLIKLYGGFHKRGEP